MKRFLFIFLILSLMYGCTKSIRYSYEEIKNYPQEIQEYIKKGEVVTGMTFQQVRYAWGGPVMATALDPAPSGDERVQWEYHRLGGTFKTILRFTNGRLTEIISTEPGIAK